ncbi:thioredoxin family protein [Gammaproteobacteria bacterium]|nr:thioredoxin family protein [Gammaproteobacteria bacterium]|tara:strand:+ start:1212 stop:1673 length:462 start_codon:yes stop_codon:yes gene_type:complete
MNIALDRSECLNSPHPEPYIGSVVSEQELQDFINKTIEQSKQPIVIFGANWCPDARFLEGVLQLSSVKSFIEKYANIMQIDVGEYERNTDLFSFFDSRIKDGIPRVFVMDIGGQLLNLKTNDVMRKARELSTQEVFDYFQEFIGTNKTNSENA